MGKANMIDVVTTVAESETAIQTMVAVRDKVIAAYEEILKMLSNVRESVGILGMPYCSRRTPMEASAMERSERVRARSRSMMTGPEVMDVARDAIVTLI